MPLKRFVPVEMQADTTPEWIEAADAEGEQPKPKRFTMRAYTGGPMQVSAFYRPVVVDLAGMKQAGKVIPIFRGHDSNRIVGHGEAVISDRGIDASGIVSAENADAAEVVAAAKNGFPWQASIGATVQEMEVLSEKETATVNGRKVTGPLVIARKSTLNEISFVPIGADRRTSARVAASAGKDERTMDFHDWLQAQGFDPEQITEQQKTALQAAYDAQQKPPEGGGTGGGTAPVQASGTDGGDIEPDPIKETRLRAAAERQRIATIEAKATEYKGVTIQQNGQSIDLAAHAIEAGWTAEKYELEAMRESRPKAPAVHAHQRVASADVLEAAVCMSGGLESETLEASFGERTLDAADKNFRRIGLQELMVECAQANGYQGQRFRADHRGILQAAFSTTSLSGILSNTANKFLLEGYMHVDQAWRSIAARRSVGDFKQVTSYRMTGDFQYEEVGPGGELPHGKVDEQNFTNQAVTYGRMFAITRQMQINDDLDALTAVPRRLGRGAGLKLNSVFWTAFLDNSDFFKTANANYFEGASSNLQSSSLKTAAEKFLKQTDPDGHPVNAMPEILLVPVEESVTADELMVSLNINTGGSSTKDKVPNRNVWAGKYQTVTTPYLSNTTYTGYSTTAWYLLASPMDVPVIEVAFLNGVENPTVESADADFNTLGIQVRGYHDFGVAKQDYRGGVKSKGAS